MLKLIHYTLCPSSRAIRLTLNEAEIPHELDELKPWGLDREFLNMHPAGTLPVLMDEKRPVCGASAIVEHLQERQMGEAKSAARFHPFPSGTFERAEARRASDWFLRKLDAEVTQYLLEEKIYKPMSGIRSSPDLSAIRVARANLRYHLAYLSYLADQRRWLAGDSMSFADFAAAAQISVLDYLGEIQWDDCPEAKNWYARMKSRPAFRPLLSERLPGVNPPQAYANLDF
jgi:glutathione S-transferase